MQHKSFFRRVAPHILFGVIIPIFAVEAICRYQGAAWFSNPGFIAVAAITMLIFGGFGSEVFRLCWPRKNR